MNRRILPLALMSFSPLLGCAHAQTERTTVTKHAVAPPAPAPVTPMAAGSAPAPARCEGDLNRELSQAVLHFDFDKDVLTSSGESHLQQLADDLRQCDGARIVISGNCDERGTEEYNLALGERRAEVAKAFLVKAGVAPSRIDTLSYGFERPVDAHHNEEAWALNRRDDFSVQSGRR